jgi:TIR domain
LRDRFENWQHEIAKRELPNNKMELAAVMARELAEGTIEHFWDIDVLTLRLSPDSSWRTFDRSFDLYEIAESFRHYQVFYDEVIKQLRSRSEYDPFARLVRYAGHRFGFALPNVLPRISVLMANGYISQEKILLKPSFDLLRAPVLSNVFISYRRNVSSAFALLVSARLKAFGINGFLDMSILPGEDWIDDIQRRIRNCNAVILLLAPGTLESEHVHKEIEWSLEARSLIIPIYHAGLKSVSADSGNPLAPRIHEQLKNINGIHVLDESAASYNNAIVQLLNRFGVTP